MKRDRLCQLRDQIAGDLAAGVEVGIGSLGLGVFGVDGRQISLSIEETGTDLLRVSDAGESWGALFMAGLVGPSPRPSEREKLRAVCSSLDIDWDARRRSLVAFSKPDRLGHVARRILAGSLTLDGWRYWLDERGADSSNKAEAIVNRLEQLGEKSHWQTERWANVRGAHRANWRARALLRRGDQRVAVTFLGPSSEHAIEQMAGWVLDTELPIVFVGAPKVANDVGNDPILDHRARVVAKCGARTAAAVLEAAEIAGS